MDIDSSNLSHRNFSEEIKITVHNCSNQFKRMLRRTAIDLRDMGLHLLFLKRELGDELFTEWLKSVFGCDRLTDAVNLMRLSKHYEDNNFTDLGIAGSLLFHLNTHDLQVGFPVIAVNKEPQDLQLAEPLHSELHRRAKQMGINLRANVVSMTSKNETQTEAESQSLTILLKKLLNRVGTKCFNKAVAQSIYREQAASLCNLCFDYMDEVDFSQLNVEQIKLSKLDSKALQQLLEETQRELSNRHQTTR